MQKEGEKKAKEKSYRDGGEGFIRWMEENVCLPIIPFGSQSLQWTLVGELSDIRHPETGKSYRQMWESQKEIIREALRMENGQFVYRLIVFCWPRGEGKSLIVCCIKLWRFFNFLRQRIVCGANSKDQVQFVHYDLMRDIILHSPVLLKKIGQKGVKEKGLFFYDARGHVQSEIRTISSFSGIVSNINAYTFSEMFDQKNPKFFVQLDGSIRNIPNAMGGIDSTVSAKTHVLYKLYLSSLKQEDPSLFFSYRCSKKGDIADYWNPNMTKGQLTSYRIKFPFGEFERYFLNLWEAGNEKVFTAEMIEATNYLGVDRMINTHNILIQMLKEKAAFYGEQRRFADAGVEIPVNVTIEEIERRLWPVEFVLRLRTPQNQPKMPELKDLEALSDIFDTNWAIMGALDRADPMKIRTSARTIVCAVAKGLIGSRKAPYMVGENEIPPYIYILIHLANVADDSLEGIKNQLKLIHEEFAGMDRIGGERWGAWDLAPWCEELGIALDLWVPTYDRQKAMFSEFYNAMKFGRFKTPPLVVPGFKQDDIFKEEASVFDHIPPGTSSTSKTGWFGSPEKTEKGGIQDDVMFTVGGAIYTGRELSVTDFRERKGRIDFGSFFRAAGLLGEYK